MGVYVKDMEMPRGCIFCPLYRFSIYRTECVLTGSRITGSEETGRNKNCPLVEVPDSEAVAAIGAKEEDGCTDDCCPIEGIDSTED